MRMVSGGRISRNLGKFDHRFLQVKKFRKPTLDNSWRPVSLSSTNQLQHYQIDMPQNGGMKMVIGYRDKDDQVFQNVSFRRKASLNLLVAVTQLEWACWVDRK